jgi:hypothetical protein
MFIGFTPHGTISKSKRIYWEAQLFAVIRSFKDGVTFYNFKLNWDRYEDDHSPAFQIELTILNLYFHFWVYQNNYTHHEEIGHAVIDESEYQKMCDDLIFFGVSIDEFDGIATDYLDQGVSPSLCYRLAYEDILKSRKLV